MHSMSDRTLIDSGEVQFENNGVDHDDLPSISAESLINAAEEQFMKNNFEEALNLARTAKQQDPLFAGIDKYVAAYEIHNADRLTNGDLYVVLGLADPLSDFKTTRKQYQTLALLVHPDKNDSAAADDAFKILLAAWEVLCQTSMREIFDRKREFSPLTVSRPAPPSPRRWGPPPTPVNRPSQEASTTKTRQSLQKCPSCRISLVFPQERSAVDDFVSRVWV